MDTGLAKPGNNPLSSGYVDFHCFAFTCLTQFFQCTGLTVPAFRSRVFLLIRFDITVCGQEIPCLLAGRRDVADGCRAIFTAKLRAKTRFLGLFQSLLQLDIAERLMPVPSVGSRTGASQPDGFALALADVPIKRDMVRRAAAVPRYGFSTRSLVAGRQQALLCRYCLLQRRRL